MAAVYTQPSPLHFLPGLSCVASTGQRVAPVQSSGDLADCNELANTLSLMLQESTTLVPHDEFQRITGKRAVSMSTSLCMVPSTQCSGPATAPKHSSHARTHPHPHLHYIPHIVSFASHHVIATVVDGSIHAVKVPSSS